MALTVEIKEQACRAGLRCGGNRIGGAEPPHGSLPDLDRRRGPSWGTESTGTTFAKRFARGTRNSGGLGRAGVPGGESSGRAGARRVGRAAARHRRPGLPRDVQGIADQAGRVFLAPAQRLVALGNWGAEDVVGVLTRALESPEPLVRGHVAWALGRVGSASSAAALSARLDLEPDEWVIGEFSAAQGVCPSTPLTVDPPRHT